MKKKKKTFHVLVRCENGYERKVLWGTPKHNKAAFKYIAPLGTHTRESLTATAASEQLSGSSGRGRTKKYDREKEEEEEEEEEEDEDEDDGGEDSDEVPSFSSDYMNSIEEGDRHDVLDVYKSSKTGATARRWRKANIVRTNGPKVLVNFEGWSSEYNVWIDLGKEPTRIARIGEHTSSDQQPKKSNTAHSGDVLSVLRVDDECYGKDEYRSKQTNEITFTWRLAKVIEVQDGSVKLHFDGWHSRWDEWFELNGERLMTVEEYASLEKKETGGGRDGDGSTITGSSGGGRQERTGAQNSNSTVASSRTSSTAVVIRTSMPRTRGEGLVGLENLGNTCFMNSCLQCLINTTPLAAYFLEEAHLREMNPKSQSGGRFAGAFGEFIRDYWSTRSQGVVKAPRQLKKVASCRNSFSFVVSV